MVSPMIGLLLLPATAALHVPQMRGPSRFFLDTADVVEWQTLLPLGIFHGHAIPLLATPSRAALNPLPVPPSGVTTNPVLLERAAVPCTVPACQRLADQAFALGAHELMLQAWGGGREALVSCGLALSEPDRDRLVIKLPVTEEGTAAAAALAPLGVRVCLTACYAKHQAIVAVGVGAEYLAPYLGRIDDAGMVSGIHDAQACYHLTAPSTIPHLFDHSTAPACHPVPSCLCLSHTPMPVSPALKTARPQSPAHPFARSSPPPPCAQDGHAEIEAMQSIVQGLGGTTRVMAASIRDANSLARLAAAGKQATRGKQVTTQRMKKGEHMGGGHLTACTAAAV
jgi:transaldolase